MNNKENQKSDSAFAELVEKKIQVSITKSKNSKKISEPKPKSGKGL